VNGDLVEYTINVTNRGPDNATGLSIIENLPSGVIFVSASTVTGGYNDTTNIWNIGNLANGASATLKIVVKLNTSGSVNNTVSVVVDQNNTGDNGTNGNGSNVIVNPNSSSNTTSNITLNGSDLVMYYKNGSFIAQLVNSTGPLAGETITFIINGVSYNRTTDTNGIASIAINLNPGNYTIISVYSNANLFIVNNIEILPTLIGANVTKYYKNGTQFHVLVLDGIGNPIPYVVVSVNIHGKFYNITTNASGIATLDINLNPGEYIITAIHPIDGLMRSYTIVVLNSFGESSSDFVMYFRNGSNYYVKVLDDMGNPLVNATVLMNIHGVFYNRTTNASGVATLQINLNPGMYIITAIHPLNGLMVSSFITVLTVLTGTDVYKVFGDPTPYKATLLNGTYPSNGLPYPGQKIVLNVHGVLYSKTTDVNGEIFLDINLNPGTYIITAYYGYVNETVFEYATSNTIVVARP
jgi:uncharacterized repeat protein (TIGR01451 family)